MKLELHDCTLDPSIKRQNRILNFLIHAPEGDECNIGDSTMDIFPPDKEHEEVLGQLKAVRGKLIAAGHIFPYPQSGWKTTLGADSLESNGVLQNGAFHTYIRT
ncbi:hypothetical protein ACFL2V_12630, partial [Pseudomonadota bacterium]